MKIYGLSTESKMGRVVSVVVLWSSISLRINDHQSGSIRSQRIVLSYHKPEIMRFSTGNIRSEFIRIFWCDLGVEGVFGPSGILIFQTEKRKQDDQIQIHRLSTNNRSYTRVRSKVDSLESNWRGVKRRVNLWIGFNKG